MLMPQGLLTQKSQVPTPVPPGQPAPFVMPVSAIPQTTADVRATRIKIDDMRRQLQDFAERRSNVASQLKTADIDARQGFQDRLANLDRSINILQDQITQANLALSQAPSQAFAGSVSPDPQFLNRAGDNIVPIFAILSVFVLAPLTITLARFIWKRSGTPPRPMVDQATMQRLDSLQQSVDTIAIEVERISEGQRFVTKLLADRPAAHAQLER